MYRILIVEDDAVIAAAMERQITQWGLEARCVRDFRAVLEEFRAYDPHLVLLDLTLPSFATTGAGRSGPPPAYRSSSCPRQRTTSTSSWP